MTTLHARTPRDGAAVAPLAHGENSAAYLRSHLPGPDLLDVGCGPGTITADLAALVAPGRVTAWRSTEDALALARAEAATPGVDNVDFAVADVHALDLRRRRFDVVHAHQVLQHVADPVAALREMRRVAKPGGVVAARDSDYAAFTWYPRCPSSTSGWRSTSGSPAPTAASPTPGGGCSPGPARPASPTSTATASTWCLRRRPTSARGGAACGPTGS